MWHYVNPISWFGWFAKFLQAWVVSLPWRKVAGAMPAIVVLMLMAVGGAISWSASGGWREDLVINHVTNAFSEKKYDVAELMVERLLRDDPSNKTLQMQLALIYEATDRNVEAREIFREQALQFENEKAVQWLLRNEYRDVALKDLSSEQFAELAELARIQLKFEPDNFGLNSIRTRYWLQQNNIGEAIKHMAKMKEVQLDVGLKMAILYKQQGDMRRANTVAEETANRLSSEIEKTPDRADIRLLHAQVFIFLEKYDEAVRSLAAGYDRTKDERLRHAIGETIIAYSQTLAKQGNNVQALVTRLKLLQQAVRLAPTNPAVLKAIADTVLSTVNEEDKQVVALRESILTGASPEIGHFVRGTAAMLKGDSKLAAIELRLAAKGLPESAAILNNLAVAKTANARQSGHESDELTEALDLANKAIELTKDSESLTPQLPYFHETRGQIYLALGKYEDAIADLDEALKADALKIQANVALAEAYRGLDQTEVADEHLAAADRLRSMQQLQAEQGRDAIEQFGEQLKNAENVLPEAAPFVEDKSKTEIND